MLIGVSATCFVYQFPTVCAFYCVAFQSSSWKLLKPFFRFPLTSGIIVTDAGRKG